MNRFLVGVIALALASAVYAQTNSGGGGGSGNDPGAAHNVNTTCPTSTNAAVAQTATINGGFAIQAAKSANYTIALTDCGQIIPFTAPVTVVMTPPASVVAGFGVTLSAQTGGTITITPSGYTVNGSSAAITLIANQGLTFMLDSSLTNYVTAVGPAVASLTVAGSTGDYQINGGGSVLGAKTPGSGVDTAFQTATNANGGIVLQSGSITTGNCLKGSASGIVDAGFPCGAIRYGQATSKWKVSMNYPNAGATGAAMTNTLTLCSPYDVAEPRTIKAIGGNVSTLDAASVVSYAFYTAALGKPKTLVDYVPSMITSSTGALSGTVNNTTDALNPGAYLICAMTNSASTMVMTATTPNSPFSASRLGVSSLATAMGTSNILNGLSCPQSDTTNCGHFTGSGTSAVAVWPSDMSAATWTEVASGRPPLLATQDN